MNSRADPKVAVVTGAGRGIGFACARRFLADGYSTILLDRVEPKETIGSLGPRASFMACDVGSAVAVAAVFEAVRDQHGRLDVLVNNAAINIPAHFLELTEAVLDETLRVNVKSVLLCGQAAARLMMGNGGGAIVNIASVSATMSTPTSVPYATSKGAVVSLTRSMALGLAGHGIRVNAVAPGTVVTEMTRERLLGDEAARRRILSRTPIGRVGTPEEIAGVVAFLAGPDSSFMTGEVVNVEGGRFCLNYVMD
ncbi:SDR family oxidoreductase [Xanthobacter sp. 91]|uniref:SDR family NAD(P)-dependent oxidoreductase n=1 Tax=Xanthobacter sp. 91 TaxID=1117244 RepID=UPI0004980745|nr:SDR family oxidoreductase [Xanthobacter sp. 91]